MTAHLYGLALCALVLPQATNAQTQPAVGADIFASTDSDGTDIVRVALNFDLQNRNDEDYLGISLEEAHFHSSNGSSANRQRVFLRAADTIGSWTLQTRAGIDGHTVIGSLSAHDNAKLRKEVFVERDIVETARGLDAGIYTSFAGVAIDVPINNDDVFTVLAGYQTFTGRNNRIHMRGNFVHSVKADWGLTAQLRGRYFHSSVPFEGGYYSPKWYTDVMPVMQVRRFVDGWKLVAAAGLGMQRDSETDWRQAGFLQVGFTSPIKAQWSVQGVFSYRNAPSDNAIEQSGYSMGQAMVSILRRF
jgi:hypothetical protein